MRPRSSRYLPLSGGGVRDARARANAALRATRLAGERPLVMALFLTVLFIRLSGGAFEFHCVYRPVECQAKSVPAGGRGKLPDSMTENVV